MKESCIVEELSDPETVPPTDEDATDSTMETLPPDASALLEVIYSPVLLIV